MSFELLIRRLLYGLIFLFSLISLIAVSIYVKSEQNVGYFHTTSWFMLGFDITAIFISISLIVLVKKDESDQFQNGTVSTLQFTLIGNLMLQIIIAHLSAYGRPWGELVSGIWETRKGELYFTTFIHVMIFFPYFILMLLLLLTKKDNSRKILKYFGLTWLLIWTLMDLASAVVLIKTFYSDPYTVPDLKRINGFILTFDILQLASSIMLLIKKNFYTLTSTFILTIAQFVCVVLLKFIIPNYVSYFNGPEWTYLQVANYSFYGIAPTIIFILIIIYFFEPEEEIDTPMGKILQNFVFIIISFIAFLQFLSFSIYLGLHKSVVNENPNWDIAVFDKSYQGYCGGLIGFSIILLGLGIVYILNITEKLKIGIVFSLLLGMCGCVALSQMKQDALFESTIGLIFAEYQAELWGYTSFYQTTKEHTFLNVWDFTHVIDSMAIVTYDAFYFWLILYISIKLKAQNLSRHILYGLQFIFSALMLIAFALLYSKISEYYVTRYKIIMFFAMIFSGLLFLFSMEHFIKHKDKIIKRAKLLKIQKRTALSSMALYCLIILQTEEQPNFIFQVQSHSGYGYDYGNYINFCIVMKAVLVAYLPLQLESEIFHLIIGDETIESEEIDQEKFLTNN